MNCPDCSGTLEGQGLKRTCPECKRIFEMEYHCEVCGEAPEKIASCGSVSWFCNSCNELKSRSSMDVYIQ